MLYVRFSAHMNGRKTSLHCTYMLVRSSFVHDFMHNRVHTACGYIPEALQMEDDIILHCAPAHTAE